MVRYQDRESTCGVVELADLEGAQPSQEDDGVPGSENEGWLGVGDPKNPWVSV